MKKNKSIQFCILFVFLALVGIVCAAGAEAVPDNFVYRNGTDFYLNGTPYYFAGTNSYYLWYGDITCSAPQTNQGCVIPLLDDAKSLGLDVIRTWGFCNANSKYTYCFQPSAGTYNEATFAHFDRVIKEASNRGIKLIVPFVNNWDDFGGMNVYNSWCNITNHDEFYTNSCTKQLYKNYVSYFLNRTNTITGIKYKDDPTIFAWELANEPRCQTDKTGATLNNWIGEMSQFIKSIDPNHMVTTGVDGGYVDKGSNPYAWWYKGNEGQDYYANHQWNSIDFATFHYYHDMDPSINAAAWIQEHIEDAHNIIGKPVLFEEFNNQTNKAEVLSSWYSVMEQYGVNGNTFWMLADNYFSGTDGYDIHCPEDLQVCSKISENAAKMNKKTILNHDKQTFMKDLADSTYDFLVSMENRNGKGLPDNWYEYPATGAYASPEEAGFYMLSHVGAQKLGLIDASTAKTRIEKTISALKNNITTYKIKQGIIWELGTDEGPPVYNESAFDEFDTDGTYDPNFYVGSEPVSSFPKELNDWSTYITKIYYNLSSAQIQNDLSLYLDTLYATHDNQSYFDITVKVQKPNGTLVTIGTYKFGSDGNNPESRYITIPKANLGQGQNLIQLQNTAGQYQGNWTVWDSLSLSQLNDTGLYYRYYNTNSLGVADSNVPSIGNAMLASSLIAIKEWAKENSFTTLQTDCESIINKMQLRIFFDSPNNMFYHDLTKANHWDYYSDEGRLLSFVANALGQISNTEFTNNLDALAKPDLYYDISTGNTVESRTSSSDILVNKTSWDGSMFTYIVPALFIKEKDTEYQNSTINPAVAAQIEYATNSNYLANGNVAWGISDAYNISGDYCWEFVGTPPTSAALSSNPYETCPGLITPHASALALLSNKSSEAVDNLYNLRNYSTIYDGAYGFKDSFNANSGQVLNKILTLDQEWIFLSLMDYLNSTVWNYFYKDTRVNTTHNLMYPAPPAPEDDYIFYETFENSSTLSQNECSSCAVTSFDTGIKGNSALLGEGSSLTYISSNHISKNNGTVSFWVKPVSFNNGASGNGGNGFFDFGELGTASSFAVLRNTPTNYVYFEIKDDTNTQHGPIYKNNALTIGNWTNIVITYKFNTGGNDIMRLYINGAIALDWSGMNISFNPADTLFTVGDVGWYERADAYMDELKIHNRVKNSFEIANDYNKMINYTPPSSNFTKPQSNGTVKFVNSTLMVNNQPFFIKGVDYQPTPIGQDYEYNFYAYPSIYNRDLSLLRKMHVNAIRPWKTVTNSSFLDAVYNNGTNPIYVIMPYEIPYNFLNYSDNATRTSIRQQFRTYVTQFKDNPAVLMWSIGNENNLFYTGSMADWYSLVNDMATDAYAIEGQYYHPVTSVNWRLLHLGDPADKSDDASMNYLDAWGVNVYDGKTFGTFFGDYRIASSKPLWVAEYGVDAWHTTNTSNPAQGYEDEASQKDWVASMWDVIASEDNFGATVMEYSDEWNKDWHNGTDVNIHDYGGYTAVGAHPDNFANEEWWGLVRIAKNGTGPDILTPRQVYYALRDKFRGYNNAPVLDFIANVTANAGDTVKIIPSASDADNDDLKFSFSSPLNQSGEWKTSAGDAGNYTATITVSDGTLNDSQTIKITITNACVENWTLNYGSCLTNDTKLKYYTDSNSCGTANNLPVDNGTYVACDYCTPIWHETNTTCGTNDYFTGYYQDSNTCYAQTSLESDNNQPANNSYSCDYCTPDWTAVNTSCMPGDYLTQYYEDANTCFDLTGLESDDNAPANETFWCNYENEAPAIDSYYPSDDPVLNISDEQLFNITASDPDDDELTITWFLDGSEVQTGTSYTYTAAAEGDYFVSVDVSDSALHSNHIWAVHVLGAANTAPSISGIPDQNFDENSGTHNNILNLEDYADDAETAVSDLSYIITSQTDTGLVDCSIDSDHNLDCDVQPSQTGSSDITVEVDDGEFQDTNTFTINVDSVADTTPPASITGLNSASKSADWIYWEWTNPSDSDFAENIIYIDGTNVANTSDNYYNATGLTENTAYTIKVHTVDASGNINTNDVEDSVSTDEIIDPNAKPDLIIENIDFYKSVDTGKGYSVSQYVAPDGSITNLKAEAPFFAKPVFKNIGEAKTSSRFCYSSYVDGKWIGTTYAGYCYACPSGVQITNENGNNLMHIDPGQSIESKYVGAGGAKTSLPAGNHEVRIVVNGEECPEDIRIEESDTSNNELIETVYTD